MWHDQSLDGRISCTNKSMIFDNHRPWSFMTGGTTMNDWWYDLFATDGTTYLRVRIAGEKFWTCSKTLLRPILLARSSTTSQTSRALFLKTDIQYVRSNVMVPLDSSCMVCCKCLIVIYGLTRLLFKIYGFEISVTLTLNFQGYSRSNMTVAYLVSYWHLIVIYGLSSLIAYKASKSEWSWIWPFNVNQFQS